LEDIETVCFQTPICYPNHEVDGKSTPRKVRRSWHGSSPF